MNKETIINRVDKLNESLLDPKMIAGVIGLGLCSPILVPSLLQSFPILAVASSKLGFITAAKVSSVLINGGVVTLGGFTAYATIDTVKDLLKKEGK